MEQAKEAERTGVVLKKKKKTTVEAYVDPEIIIPIPSEERAASYLVKHKEVIGKSVRLSSVFKWYTDRQGQDYPPAVFSALRQPSVNDDDHDIDMEDAQKEAEEEEHGDEHGPANVEDEPADVEEWLGYPFEEDDNENYNGAI